MTNMRRGRSRVSKGLLSKWTFTKAKITVVAASIGNSDAYEFRDSYGTLYGYCTIRHVFIVYCQPYTVSAYGHPRRFILFSIQLKHRRGVCPCLLPAPLSPLVFTPTCKLLAWLVRTARSIACLSARYSGCSKWCLSKNRQQLVPSFVWPLPVGLASLGALGRPSRYLRRRLLVHVGHVDFPRPFHKHVHSSVTNTVRWPSLAVLFARLPPLLSMRSMLSRFV